jgi:TPR repeat protein
MAPSLRQQYQNALHDARRGNPQAQLYLAVANLKGLGVAIANATGAMWCRRAAEQGNVRAQILLGYLYRTGTGVEQDDRNAHLWFARAMRDVTLNSEVQQALIRYADLKKVHQDETGTLWRYQSMFGNATFIDVINATPERDGKRKRYFIQVPPHIEWAREAVAWTFAMHEDDYRPMRET